MYFLLLSLFWSKKSFHISYLQFKLYPKQSGCVERFFLLSNCVARRGHKQSYLQNFLGTHVEDVLWCIANAGALESNLYPIWADRSTNVFSSFTVYMRQYQVYSTSMAMLLTMVLSVYLFNFKPALQVSCLSLWSPIIVDLLSISHASEYLHD